MHVDVTREEIAIMELELISHHFHMGLKVVNSREVREVVEGTTCISDKKLSEIC